MSVEIKSTFLKGPYSLHEFKNHDKDILLIGDIHVKKSTCPDNSISIEKYIENIINENPDKIFDVFIEEDFPESRDINDISLNVSHHVKSIAPVYRKKYIPKFLS